MVASHDFHPCRGRWSRRAAAGTDGATPQQAWCRRSRRQAAVGVPENRNRPSPFYRFAERVVLRSSAPTVSARRSHLSPTGRRVRAAASRRPSERTGKRCVNDGRLGDGGGAGKAGRHCLAGRVHAYANLRHTRERRAGRGGSVISAAQGHHVEVWFRVSHARAQIAIDPAPRCPPAFQRANYLSCGAMPGRAQMRRAVWPEQVETPNRKKGATEFTVAPVLRRASLPRSVMAGRVSGRGRGLDLRLRSCMAPSSRVSVMHASPGKQPRHHAPQLTPSAHSPPWYRQPCVYRRDLVEAHPVGELDQRHAARAVLVDG